MTTLSASSSQLSFPNKTAEEFFETYKTYGYDCDMTALTHLKKKFKSITVEQVKELSDWISLLTDGTEEEDPLISSSSSFSSADLLELMPGEFQYFIFDMISLGRIPDEGFEYLLQKKTMTQQTVFSLLRICQSKLTQKQLDLIEEQYKDNQSYKRLKEWKEDVKRVLERETDDKGEKEESV